MDIHWLNIHVSFGTVLCSHILQFGRFLVGKGIYLTIIFKRNDIAEKDKLYEKLIVSLVKQFKI